MADRYDNDIGGEWVAAAEKFSAFGIAQRHAIEVAGTTNALRVNRAEMFAPVACVFKVGSYDEALATLNDTNFGLTSGIVTRSLARDTHFRRKADTGRVTVNMPTAGTDYHVPFGGRGDSSYGPREQGAYAVEFCTTAKTAGVAAGQPE